MRGEVNRGEENARPRKPWLCHTHCCSPMMSGMLLWYSSSSRRSGRFSNSGIAPTWFHDKSSDLSLGVWWGAVVAVHELCYCDGRGITHLVKVGFHSPNVLVVSIQCILARIASFHQRCLHVYKSVSDSAPCTLSSSHTFPLYVTSRSSVSGTPVGLRFLRASTRAMAAAAASLSRLSLPPLLLLLPAWS